MNKCSEDSNKNPETCSSRRSFLKKGAIVSTPLIVTAWARPVYALRCGLSGLLSGNLSYRPERDTCEMGLSPGYWGQKGTSDGWPSPLNTGTVTASNGVNPTAWKDFPKFHGTGPYHFSGTEYDDMDMLEVLSYENGSEGFHFVAALLNSLSDRVNYPLTTSDVMYLWSVKDTFEYEGMDAKEFLDTIH